MDVGTPTRLIIDGKPMWKWASGEMLPVVSGGSDIPPEPLEEPPPPGDVLTVPPLAEPPAPNGDTPPAPEGMYTQAQLEAARKQERDKLYKDLETERQQREAAAARLKELEDERAGRIKAEEDARLKAEEAERKRQEEEMSAKDLIAKRDAEYAERFESLQGEIDARDAIIAREREFAALQEYRQRRIGEMAEEIMPELRDLVFGNSPEEIEASLTSMAARTTSILGNVEDQFSQLPRPKGVSVTAPPAGPLENEPHYETISAADIAAMDMATYAKNRDRLLQGASQQARQGR